MSTDAELLERVRSDDQAAFGDLYDRYWTSAVTMTRVSCGRVNDAEDVVNGAFLSILDTIGRGAGPVENFRAYLFTVIRHEAARRYHADQLSRPFDYADDLVDDFADGPEKVLNDDLIRRAYASLSDRHRWVLQLTHVEGLTPARIAASTSLSANTVSALAYRARRELRAAYLHLTSDKPGRP